MEKRNNQTELKRYKAQLHALQNDSSYDNHEEKRKSLINFYQEKIKGFEAAIK